MKDYLTLFFTLAKVGVMTFGGGYAMLPILQREVCQSHKWLTEEEIMDYYAIGQCTPGIIAVNVATFTGKKVKGTGGAIVATLGVVFPSLVIISFIAALIHNFSSLAAVQNALAGIRVCVCVFIFNAALKLLKSAVVDKITLALYIVIFAAALLFGLSPALCVLVAGIAGVAVKGRRAAE